MMTRYQELTEKISQKEKERKQILSKISRLKRVNGTYPVNILAYGKKANDKLVEIVQLEGLRTQLEY